MRYKFWNNTNCRRGYVKIFFNLSMDETQRPFACSEKGCEMTFTNEDHLNWHQKKHDMILNLEIAKNNDVADQTPTPTRFIRNCEEVGLFQDLQNVNPFDEFFKKAVEVTKTGGTLEIPETNSDDTLHTPHILPHIEENQKKINNANNQDDNNSQSNDFTLNNVIPITTTAENTCENDNNITECDATPIIVIDDDSNDKNDIKKKIKEALQNKEKQKIEKENLTSTGGGLSISVVPFQTLAIPKDPIKNTTDYEKCFETREKIREMNRAAQIRCRKRKQIRWREMEEEINLLKQENKKLKTENNNLRAQLTGIKEKSLNKNNVSEPVQGTIIGTLVPVIIQQKTIEKGPTSASSNTAISPVVSCTPIEKNCTSIAPNPVGIQIVPNASNLTIPVMKNLHCKTSAIKIKLDSTPSMPKRLIDTSEQKKVKRKKFTKIVRKIIVEN